MDKLPAELTDLIVGHLPKPLRLYSTVSKQFQKSVELLTLRTIAFESGELPTFDVIYRFPRRLSALRQIRYVVLLPTYPPAIASQYETIPEWEANNKFFTQAVAALLHKLAQWQFEFNCRPWISLQLGVWSRSDNAGPSVTAAPDDLREFRYRRNHIRITSPTRIVPVRIIRSLVSPKFFTRTIETSSIIHLAQRLPLLERIDWNWDTDERRFLDLRRHRESCKSFIEYNQTESANRQWAVFCDSLLKLDTRFLKILKLDFQQKGPGNHDHDMSRFRDLVPPGRHRLSLMLHGLSQSPNLVTFSVSGVGLSPDIFWPYGTEGTTRQLWPRLQVFNVHLDSVDFKGDWFYEEAPEDDLEEVVTITAGEIALVEAGQYVIVQGNLLDEFGQAGDIPWQQFRRKLSTSKIAPFVVAMTNASWRINRLNLLGLTFSIGKGTRVAFMCTAESGYHKQWSIRKERKVQWDDPQKLIHFLEKVSGTPGSVKLSTTTPQDPW